jgi:hypothetical protein
VLERSQMPSAGLPDYLKAELQVGEASQFPLVSVLDEVVARLSARAFLRVQDLGGATASLASRTRELERLGMRVDTLSDAERDLCFARRMTILSSKGTLTGVSELAGLYFPGCRVALGLPHGGSRLGQSDRVRLADTSARRHIVFVRTANVQPEARCREFLQNADRLVPHPFEVVVALPQTPREPATRWCLSVPRSWEKRRISCLTSRR